MFCSCFALQRRIIQQSCQIVTAVAGLLRDTFEPLNHGLRMSVLPTRINGRKLTEQFFERLTLAFHCLLISNDQIFLNLGAFDSLMGAEMIAMSSLEDIH